MERNKALVCASVATLVLGSAVVTAAALGHVPLLGFGTRAVTQAATPVAPTTVPAAPKQRVVVRTKDVYDRLVVDTQRAGEAAGSGAPTTSVPPRRRSCCPRPTRPWQLPRWNPWHESDGETGTPETTPSTTPNEQPSPTTTPTTQRLQIPDDWPAGTPIPPVPPNCFQPELHLNGVWECHNDD